MENKLDVAWYVKIYNLCSFHFLINIRNYSIIEEERLGIMILTIILLEELKNLPRSIAKFS